LFTLNLPWYLYGKVSSFLRFKKPEKGVFIYFDSLIQNPRTDFETNAHWGSMLDHNIPMTFLLLNEGGDLLEMYIKTAQQSKLIAVTGQDRCPCNWENVKKRPSYYETTHNLEFRYMIEYFKECEKQPKGHDKRKTHCYQLQDRMTELFSTSLNISKKAAFGLFDAPDIPQNGIGNNFYFVRKRIYTVMYCSNKKENSSMFLSWLQIGFDEIGWILILCSYLGLSVYGYLYILKVKYLKREKHDFSWLTGISLIFYEDNTPLSKKCMLIPSLCFWVLSTIYECFVKSEETAPFDPKPFNNISEAYNDGYRFLKSDENTIIEEILPEYNLDEIRAEPPELQNAQTIPHVVYNNSFYVGAKILTFLYDTWFHDFQFHKSQWHLFTNLNHTYYNKGEYWNLKTFYVNEIFYRIVNCGLLEYINGQWLWMRRQEYLGHYDRLDYLNGQPLKMTFTERIYTIFVICGFCASIAFLVCVGEMLVKNRTTILTIMKMIPAFILSVLKYIYSVSIKVGKFVCQK
jgi:hypothetical protein